MGVMAGNLLYSTIFVLVHHWMLSYMPKFIEVIAEPE